ncbi:MAG: UvrD-helicase domain-containing protein [Candidatus Thorarchaeota archaeon]
MFSLSNQKKELLKTKGHLLVLGGPGSGKTTIALIKAKRIIEKGIKEGQKILFLSFARATVKRVEEKAVELKLSPEIQKKIEINTYHGFTWNLLRSYGYLINLKYPFQLLPPPEAASHLAEIKEKEKRQMEKLRLFNKEGILHFDLFAKYSAELLAGSKSLNEMICDVYPEIIFDEFQDTNNDEWQVIQNLGKKSRLIALADPDQRIYEFRGADPARIGEFIKAFRPHQFDFGNENNRSNGTDIVQFGNDLLTGANKKKKYNDVNIVTYQFRKGNNIHSSLKNEVIKSIQRQNKTDKKKMVTCNFSSLEKSYVRCIPLLKLKTKIHQR